MTDHKTTGPEPSVQDIGYTSQEQIAHAIASKLHDQGTVPGHGGWAIPHYLTFSGLVQAAARAYRWTFDEALRHSLENALAMRRDPVIIMSLRARQIPVTQLGWKLEMPISEDHPQWETLSRLTSIVEKTIRSIRGWSKLLLSLSEALWYGKSAVHVQYEWKYYQGHRVLSVKRWYPINGDKIRWKWDGTPGIQIFPASDIRGEPTDRSVVHWLQGVERDQFIIHSYELEDPDWVEPELGGSIFGVGIRSRLYWIWYLKSLVLSYLLSYIERVGVGGITIFFYESDNKRSFEEVKTMVERQINQHVILFPRNRDGSQGGPGVMRLENTGAAISMFQGLVNEYFDKMIQRLILGQELTYVSGASGLGSGVAELHGDTFSRLIKHDALSLADTLTHDLVHVIFRYSFPDVSPTLYPSFSFLIDPPNAASMLEYAQVLTQMGLAVDEGQLREITGLVAPKKTDAVANVNIPPYVGSESAVPFLAEAIRQQQQAGSEQ